MRKYAKTDKELLLIIRRIQLYTSTFPYLSNARVANWLLSDVAQCYNKGRSGRKALLELIRSHRVYKLTLWQKLKRFFGK
jgi:hypothetical protein